MRTRIKICGITRPTDAAAITAAGVDAIGLIFVQDSPRAVDRTVASEIAAQTAPFTTIVGVFVNSAPNEIEHILQDVPITCLQFHGDENAKDCERYGIPYIKAVRMKEGLDAEHQAINHPNSKAILLDSYDRNQYGGTGHSFSWQRAKGCRSKPVILAGGLSANNVAEALMLSGACGLDVSTGVEESPGVKDVQRIKELIGVVKAYDEAITSSIDSSGNDDELV